MKAVVAAFNQVKALVGAFSVIVQLHRLIDLRHYYQHILSHSPARHLGAVFGSIQPQYTAEAALTKRLSEVVLLGQIKLCAYFL